MSFFKNIFSSKPSTEELIQATSKSISLAVVEAMKKAAKPESRKRQAKELQEPEQKPTPDKEPKKRRVEATEPTPAPTPVEANPADVKAADVKPAIVQEPVLLSSKTETPGLSLLTEREVASLSAEETKRKQEEADKFLTTLVMNRVRLEQQNNLQQALAEKANKLLGALTGRASKKPRKSKPKSKKKKGSTEPPRVTCAAMTTKGKRCRRKPSDGSNKCSEHAGLVEQTEERAKALGCDLPNVPKHKITDDDVSDYVDSDNDE